MRKLCFFLFCLCAIFLISPSVTHAANQCPGTVTVDRGHCKTNTDPFTGQKSCQFVVDYANKTVVCDQATCKTTIRVCSSNDCLAVPDANGNCGPSSYDSAGCSYASCGSGGGSCDGPDGGPCSGSCGNGQVCRAATAGNGGACGCHPSGGGGICHQEKDCRKSQAAGGSGCNGSGLSPASGCSGCNSNQVCCSRQTCCYPSDPTAPTLNLPTNGSSVTTTTVTLSWSPPSTWGDDCINNSDKQFKVYWGFDSSTPFLYGTTPFPTPANKFSTPFLGEIGETYYWKVVAVNGTKQKSSAIRSFKITGNVDGTVYYSDTNSCSTATPWNQGAGLSVTLTNPGSRTANIPSSGANAGKFSIPAPNGTYGTLRLTLPTGFICSTACSQACPTKTTIAAPGANHNFFITRPIINSEAWWQVVGGPVYAGSTANGTTIRSQLPQATDKLILPGSGGGTDAALIRASGTVDLGPGTVSTSGWNTKATYKGKKTDFDYFAAGLGVIKNQNSDWLSANVIDLPSYPATKDFGYMKPVSGTATLASAWNIPSGQKYVIFVDGDLQINQNITVAPGGFLALIVKGDVSVGAGVANIQGLYVANGDFITLSQYVAGVTNDVALNVQGSVVAWGTVDLQRNLGGPANTSQPAEKFTHRPDLLTNMPEKMKSYIQQWQEVPAGSF